MPRAYSSPAPQEDAPGDRQRDHRGGKHEQHRDEDELRGHGRAASHLEIEPERDGVGDEQERHGDQRGRTVRRQERGHQAGNREEEHEGDDKSRSIAGRETTEPPRPLFLDHALRVGIET